MTEWLIGALAGLASSPATLFLAIVLGTFVLADAATVAVGLLAAKMVVDPTLAVAAVVAGTIAGDLALYAVGRWLGATRLAARLRTPVSDRVEHVLRRRGLYAVVIARAVPGTRLPAFLAAGVVRLDAARSALVIAGTALVWTPALFWVSRGAGGHLLGMITPSNVAIAAGLIAATFLAARLGRSASRARAPLDPLAADATA